MRISDWSSDVCSSDLSSPPRRATPTTTPTLSPPTPTNSGCNWTGCSDGTPPPQTRRRHARASRRHRQRHGRLPRGRGTARARSRTLRSEEHTSELLSLMRFSYAVFFLINKYHTSLYFSIL